MRAVGFWPFGIAILPGVYLLVFGSTLGRIFGGAMVAAPLLAWLRVKSDWRGRWIWGALVAVIGVVAVWFGIYFLATGTRVFFAALTLLAGAALLGETYRRLRAWHRQSATVEGARVSPKVVRIGGIVWLVGALLVFYATLRTGSTILALLVPLFVLGGWLLLLYLQRAPRRDWYLAWVIWGPFLVGMFAQHPIASSGYAVLASLGGYWVWPRLRSRREAAE